MSVSDDRKYTKAYIQKLLGSVKGKTLGEVDSSGQFERAQRSPKITGIAGDVIEQSVFKYSRDNKQEQDIEIDGILTELKTTGVRIPKSDLKRALGKTEDEYNKLLGAKEGISITNVTFSPDIQRDFITSHFWRKLEHLLIVMYEYKSYDVVPAAAYKDFPIVDFCYTTFSGSEAKQLQCDWEIVRDYLHRIYELYPTEAERNENLVGFTHKVRPNLLLIELVPGFREKISNGIKSYQKPRYRLKQTFVDYIIRGHFDKSRVSSEIQLKESFSSFQELDDRCHKLTSQFGGLTLNQLKRIFNIKAALSSKNFAEHCILAMFEADCKKLNQISDFVKAGIITKTITITPKGGRTEDMKLKRVDFEEWADRDVDFDDSEVYSYFCEHNFLCPIFCEWDSKDPSKTTFLGFKRFSFDLNFLENEVYRTWKDVRSLIHHNELEWEYEYDRAGNLIKNKSGSYKGAPNLPKSADHIIFFRGGESDSSEEARSEVVNGIHMLPQFFWIKGSYIAERLKSIDFL